MFSDTFPFPQNSLMKFENNIVLDTIEQIEKK